MTTLLTKLTIISMVLFFILSGCSKEAIIRNPIPTPLPGDTTSTEPLKPVEKGLFRFTTALDLTGQPYHNSNLHAVVTITNDKNEEVIKDRMLTLDLNPVVKSSAIELPVGIYKLTSYRLVYGSVNTHFAAPITGSVKASSVQKPLALDFNVEKTRLSEIPVEVLKVNGDRPQAFGYPAGAFDNNQSENSLFIKVKIKAVIQIGDILYDSIPASFRLTTWNDKGEMTTSYGSLTAGANEIQLLKSAVKYEFMVSKWGTNDIMTLNRQDVEEGAVYTLGGSKAAKKLKSERTYKQVNGTYAPESKTDYFYDHTGKLLKIDYWLKKNDSSPDFDMTDKFEYNGKQLSKIKRINSETNTIVRVTTFTYDAQGKIIGISEDDNGVKTNATVEYLYSPRHEVKIHYNYPERSYNMDYYMRFTAGNMLESSSSATNHNNALGSYRYDFNINPYIHMNWPNLFLSNSSKNNLTFQNSSYQGSFPAAEPYRFNYTYDYDGYPTELVKDFKALPSGNYIFSTKTVFLY